MSNILSINELDFITDPKFIFTANTPDSKGLSYKTYTITLPYSSKNNMMLNNIWGSGVQKQSKFEAVFQIENITLKGWLKITDVNDSFAQSIFVSGSGYLWEKMEGIMLSDIDMSDKDIQLTPLNVINSETGTPFIVFDLSDRGAFKDMNSIDVSDRFPAINLKQLLTRIFNHFNVSLEVDEMQGDEYLLYTQDSNFRNSSEWLQDAACEADGKDITNIQTGSGTQSFSKTFVMQFPDKKLDNGINFNELTGVYTIPENGTYRFVVPHKIEIDKGTTSVLITNDFGWIAVKKNGTIISQNQFSSLPYGIDTKYLIDGVVDTKPIQLAAGDLISIEFNYQGIASYPSGAWAIEITQNEGTMLNVQPSRYYGTNSIVKISEILPQQSVLSFIKTIIEYFNADVFFDDLQGIVSLRLSDSIDNRKIDIWDYEIQVEDDANTLIELATDKVLPPPNYFINVNSDNTIIKKLAFGRTYFGRCQRLGVDSIPIFWNSGIPTAVEQFETPPEQKTAGSLRVLRKSTAKTGSYTMTYGYGVTFSSQVITSILSFQEIDIYDLHIRSAALINNFVTCYAKLTIEDLQFMKLFKSNVVLTDRDSGETLNKCTLLQAEQVEGSIFKLYAQSNLKNDVNTSDKLRAVGDTNTFQGMGSGSSQTSTNTIPDDTWQSSVAAQISGLTEKTSPADADNFVIDDSSASNAKKRITWSNIKTALSSVFYGAYSGQFNGTAEKTALANGDLIVIEDSAATYAKKSVSWTNIKVFLKTYFDNIYYGNVAGQFNATAEKTTLTNADLIIIEDSASTPTAYAKKKVSWTNIKVFLKATGAEINSGTEDDKFITPKAVLESNIFVRLKANQFKDTTEKTTLANNDTFIIDDSDAVYVKKSVKWSSIVTKLNNLFFGNSANQFSTLAEKTTTASNDIFVIEDSQNTFNKKKYKVGTLIAALKNYFDTIYYGNVAGQFNATPDKSTIVSNDIFIIEDSADANKKKKVLFSVLKSVLGLWTAVTNGIKTSHRVGINADPSANEWLKVKGNVIIDGSDISSTYTVSVLGQYGLNVSSTGNSEATIQAYSSGGNIGVKSIADITVAGMFISKNVHAIHAIRDSIYTNTAEPILSLVRETSGTAADGIGALIEFGIKNAAGNVVYPAYLGARFKNAATGATEIVFYLGSTVRAKLTDEFDFQLTEGHTIIPSNKAYYLGEKTTDGSWRMQISGSDLIMQRRIAGSWVTKNTITG